jgi:hypothetical protein
MSYITFRILIEVTPVVAIIRKPQVAELIDITRKARTAK